uniref:hypothetical protein n=1 Tax=Streptosarcina costaricana TaxID=2058783 RepID=UPI00286C62C5|nr:hypothetical protein RMD91_pgp002 [Streptosarcina costaricana]WKT08921.1 hypothetical protein [Streptosarcina costaricana]
MYPLMRKKMGKGVGSIVDQKRSVFGWFSTRTPHLGMKFYFRIIDLKGWGDRGLKELASSVGVQMANKGKLDLYKACMLQALIKDPETFIQYAADDAKVLRRILHEQTELINKFLQDLFNLPTDQLFSVCSIPKTTGKLVSEVLILFLKAHWDQLLKGCDTQTAQAYFQALMCKHGHLDPEHKQYSKHLHLWEQLHQLDLSGLNKDSVYPVLKSFKSVYEFSQLRYLGFSHASIPYILSGHTKNSGCYNALVTGGRTVNELSSEYFATNTAYLDLVSCYGSALRDLYIPLGILTVYTRAANEKQVTLGDFLSKKGGSLIPRLWTITVSGELTFEQNLVFSKLTKPTTFQRFAKWSRDSEYEEDNPHLEADMALLRKEIVNGIITSDVLELIEKVSTNQELSEWKGLKVISAKYWLKEERCDNPNTYATQVLQDRGKYEWC